MSERIVTVASTTNIVVATMWREILVAEGIQAQLGGSTMATSVYAMVPQLGTIDLLVREADASRARELIDEAESEEWDTPAAQDPETAP